MVVQVLHANPNCMSWVALLGFALTRPVGNESEGVMDGESGESA